MRNHGLGANYRRLWLASAISNLADGVFRLALPLLAVQLTDGPGPVAAVAFAQQLPWLVMVLPAGALADRLDRRSTMIRVDIVRVVVMGGVAAAVAADVAGLPFLCACALVLGVGETLFDTAAQSILPSVVDRSDLSTANSRLFAVEMTTNQFVGPLVGGLLAGASMAMAFGVSAAGYLLAAGALALLTGSFRPARSGATRMRTDIVEGLRFVWSNPVLRTMGVMLGVTNLAFTAFFTVFVVFAVAPGPMGLTEAQFGLCVAGTSIGGIAGSWVAPRLERALGRTRCLAVAVVLFGATLTVPALTADVAANVAAATVVAGASVVWNVVTVSLRQRITPDHLLGRMNAAYRLLGWGTMPIGAALGGALAELTSLQTTFALAAAVHVPLLAGFAVLDDARIDAMIRAVEQSPLPDPSPRP